MAIVERQKTRLIFFMEDPLSRLFLNLSIAEPLKWNICLSIWISVFIDKYHPLDTNCEEKREEEGLPRKAVFQKPTFFNNLTTFKLFSWILSRIIISVFVKRK